MDLSEINKVLTGIEGKLNEFSKKADDEMKSIGKVSSDTKASIENITLKQRELADELLQLKQRGTKLDVEEKTEPTWGEQLTKSDNYKAFAGNQATKVR